MFFSIITINRNNAKGLEDTIQSVLSQDRNLYEFIIIDGASSDNSLEVINMNRKFIIIFPNRILAFIMQ